MHILNYHDSLKRYIFSSPDTKGVMWAIVITLCLSSVNFSQFSLLRNHLDI